MRGQPLRAPFQAPRADLISLTALGRQDGRASETENQRLETQPHVGPSLGKGAHPARAPAAEPAHWGLHPVVRISTPPGKAAVTPVQGSMSLLVANLPLWASDRRSLLHTVATLTGSSCDAPSMRDVDIPGSFLADPVRVCRVSTETWPRCGKARRPHRVWTSGSTDDLATALARQRRGHGWDMVTPRWLGPYSPQSRCYS